MNNQPGGLSQRQMPTTGTLAPVLAGAAAGYGRTLIGPLSDGPYECRRLATLLGPAGNATSPSPSRATPSRSSLRQTVIRNVDG
ncbi:hypothetical protein ABZ897_39040 [Nonomuraea sp. NPDC046802]|uniref:hypothetical protein n=1 Tax=Nonomuraea sp. NPDC046802 TaxID=3154919 RepID=UPI0033CC4C57